MPNWACGTVTVTGTAGNIKGFLSRFLFDDWKNPEQYFARSFAADTYASMVKAVDACARGNKNARFSYDLSVEFAWSAYSCIVDGYPQRAEKECITLEEACAVHNVTAEVFTEECGMYFAEHIICTPDGFELNECVDLVTYQCQHCGNTQGYSPYADLDDMECCECGHTGEENWKACGNSE